MIQTCWQGPKKSLQTPHKTILNHHYHTLTKALEKQNEMKMVPYRPFMFAGYYAENMWYISM